MPKPLINSFIHRSVARRTPSTLISLSFVTTVLIEELDVENGEDENGEDEV